MIVAQARSPVFYREYGVPDTIGGRFDLLLLHLSLVVERLMRKQDGNAFGQALFDRFCTDMDDNLREMGIGDLAVPKHMKRVGEAFYGRSQAYQAALAERGDRALVEALIRNVYGGVAPDPAAPARLAAYIRRVAQALDRHEPADLLAGRIVLPDPRVVPAELEAAAARD
ncbi:MAG TPA: ubiquinol-cytochrome C chaperone family protein [Pseudolabrys sp.]|nr:ubiquinol-cytochrome C chaperone family protein [Pseudolabrys sp.]